MTFVADSFRTSLGPISAKSILAIFLGIISLMTSPPVLIWLRYQAISIPPVAT